MADLEDKRAPLLYYIKLCASFQSHQWVIVRKSSIQIKIGYFFCPCDLEIWWMTFTNNKVHLLYDIKLCASFQSHQWIQTGNAQFGSILAIFCPERKIIGHLFYDTSSYVHHSKPSVHSNWNYSPETLNLGSKLVIFLSGVILKFDGWPYKQKGTSPKLHQALCIISSTYVNSNWNYGPETAKLVLTSVTLVFDLWPWPFAWTSLLSLVIIAENVMIWWWELISEKGVRYGQMDGRRDGQKDRQTDGLNHS